VGLPYALQGQGNDSLHGSVRLHRLFGCCVVRRCGNSQGASEASTGPRRNKQCIYSVRTIIYVFVCRKEVYECRPREQRPGKSATKTSTCVPVRAQKT
jgi:hypothetical protein